jgi:hypothetical protein
VLRLAILEDFLLEEKEEEEEGGGGGEEKHKIRKNTDRFTRTG